MPKPNTSLISFTKREQRGFIALAILIITILLFPIIYLWLKPEPKINFAEFEKSIEVLEYWDKPHNVNITDTANSSNNVIIKRLDLNSSDETDMMTLKGIGEVYANRIIKYRHLLGGYYSVEQLHEIYGLKNKPKTIEAISEYLYVDAMLLRKIDVNKATLEGLEAHPYISSMLAKQIIIYRIENEFIESINKLFKQLIIEPEVINKLKYYLTIEDC